MALGVLYFMLTQLPPVKARLEIAAADVTRDDLLTRAIEAVSTRFDRECNRTLARTVGATQEFSVGDTEVIAACYPIETVTKFEMKATEADGGAGDRGSSEEWEREARGQRWLKGRWLRWPLRWPVSRKGDCGSITISKSKKCISAR
jgi:hypothetical protein